MTDCYISTEQRGTNWCLVGWRQRDLTVEEISGMWLVRLELGGLEPQPVQTLIHGTLLLTFKLEHHLEVNKLIFHNVRM